MKAEHVNSIRFERGGYVTRCVGDGSKDWFHHHAGEHELHYISSGSCRFLNGQLCASVPTHGLVFTEADRGHSVQRSGVEGYSLFYLLFKAEQRGRELVHRLTLAFDRVGFIQMGLELEGQIERILMRHQSKSPLLRASAQHHFMAFLYEVLRLAETPSLVSVDRHTSWLISRMQRAVYGRLDLARIAKERGISKPHLIRVFKRSMGEPPLRYFNRLKVDAARHLLTRSRLSLRAIAEQLSFCDEFYLSRVFKKYTGVSPSEYRKGSTLLLRD